MWVPDTINLCMYVVSSAYLLSCSQWEVTPVHRLGRILWQRSPEILVEGLAEEGREGRHHLCSCQIYCQTDVSQLLGFEC